MPYPNEWAARQQDPKQFARIIRKRLGAGIALLIGFYPHKSLSQIQSIRFDKSKWTKREARAWLKRYDFRAIVE